MQLFSESVFSSRWILTTINSSFLRDNLFKIWDLLTLLDMELITSFKGEPMRWILLEGRPSLRRFVLAVSVYTRLKVDEWSIILRLISSGTFSSKDLFPASKW